MKKLDSFVKRAKKERGEVNPIIYHLTSKVKRQIYIFMCVTNGGVFRRYFDFETFSLNIVQELRESLGLVLIGDGRPNSLNARSNLKYFKNEKYSFTKELFDFLLNNEVSSFSSKQEKIDYELMVIEEICRRTVGLTVELKISYTSFVDKINSFLTESSVGYIYSAELGMLVKLSNAQAYDNLVKPVLEILSNKQKYKDANQRFENALISLKEERYSDSMTHLGSCVESVLRVINNNQNKNDTIPKLIEQFIKNNEKLKSHQSTLTALPKLLESVATLRNNFSSAHALKESPEKELVEYALYMTASILIFLINCSK